MNILVNSGVIVAATVEGAVVLNRFFSAPVFIFKLIIISIFLLVSMFVLEPERIKVFGYISAGVVFSIGRIQLTI